MIGKGRSKKTLYWMKPLKKNRASRKEMSPRRIKMLLTAKAKT